MYHKKLQAGSCGRITGGKWELVSRPTPLPSKGSPYPNDGKGSGAILIKQGHISDDNLGGHMAAARHGMRTLALLSAGNGASAASTGSRGHEYIL